MNAEEVLSLMDFLAAEYESFQVTHERVEIWQKYLADLSIDEARRAIDLFIRTSGSPFAPTVSQVIEAARQSRPRVLRIVKAEQPEKEDEQKRQEVVEKQLLDARKRYPHLYR